MTTNEIKKAFAFFPQLKKSLWISFFISVFGVLTGYLLPEEIQLKVVGFVTSALSEIHFSFSGIFFNNFRAALIILLGGLLFSVPSVLFAFFNFLMLGVFADYAGGQMGLEVFLSGIWPHGIFELSAIFFTTALALFLTANLTDEKKRQNFGETIRSVLLLFAVLVVPALILAALIEVYVTPLILMSAGVSG